MPTFPEILKELRTNKNISQKKIAKDLGFSESHYQTYEYGKTEPTISKLIKLANYFDVSVDYLIGRTDDPEVHFIDFGRTVKGEILGGGILKPENEKAND